jgi:hypothetical protein
VRDGRTPPVIFSLQEAQALLPTVKQLTAEAVRRSDELGARLLELSERDPAHAEIAEALEGVVSEWAGEVRALGVEVKGPWLVDFDNGHGYYCWRYPEESIAHYHDYDAGFAGRMKIL